MGPLPSGGGNLAVCSANPVPRACGVALSRMAVGPCGEVFGKDLWQEGSLDRFPLWDQGGCSEWCDLGGVSTQKC